MQPWTLFCSIFKTAWNTCYGVLTPDEGSGWNVRSVAALLFSVFLSGSACVLPGLIIPFLCPGLFLTVTSGWHKVLPLWWGGSPIPWKPSCQRLHNSIALLGSPDCFVCLSQNVIVAKIKCWVRSHSGGGGFLPGFQQRRQHKQNPRFLESLLMWLSRHRIPFFTPHIVS